MVEYKEVIGWVFGASIAIAWVVWALITPGDMLGLVICISISIIFGVISGGLAAISQEKASYKEVLGWLLGASIAVTWVAWALLYPGSMVGLAVAIAISILFGTISGGLIALEEKAKIK
ncbi:MAG: hypothetical protein ACFFDB_18720 [Promethearchaeota archaeon]